MIRVTIVQVAETCGVAQSTVSRALSGHPSIPETTRLKIRETAEHLGYRPDPGAANLVAHRWQRDSHRGTLGVALIQRRDAVESRRDGPLLQRAAQQAALTLDVLEITETGELENLPKTIRARGLSGAILALLPWEEEVAALRKLAETCPMVIANHPAAWKIAPTIVRDAHHRVWDAVEGISRQGYRRILLAVPAGPGEVFQRMRAAFLLLRERAGQTTRLGWCPYHGSSVEPVSKAITKWEPDALLGFDDYLRAAIPAAGRTEAETGFASMATCDPAIAGVGDTREEVIEESCQVLKMLIRANVPGRSLDKLCYELRGEWRNGPSLPPRIDTPSS